MGCDPAQYDVLGKKYQVARVVNKKGRSRSANMRPLKKASSAVEGPYQTTIALPPKGKRGTTNKLLDVETLSLSDLDEVERMAARRAQASGEWKKESGHRGWARGADFSRSIVWGEKRHYGPERDVPPVEGSLRTADLLRTSH